MTFALPAVLPFGHGDSHGRRRRCGFTLIELIFVLALLAIAAVFVTSSMGTFFRGRTLNYEVRRLLSLTHYAQSRAASEGVPVVLWINAEEGTYGLTVQSSFNDTEGDVRAVSYTLEPGLTIETATRLDPRISEQEDETLGVAEGLAMIRFTPDGFFDDAGVAKITVRLGHEDGLDLLPMSNRLGFEIKPASDGVPE